MKILGLDISTTTIGRAILNFEDLGNCKLEYIDYYKPIKGTIEDKNHDFLYTLSAAKSSILNLIEVYQPTHIAVEDYIKFMRGGSGAATIIPLAILNRTICLGIHEAYPLIPLSICNVISIRTRIKKDSKLEDLPPKETIPKLLEKLLKVEIPRPMKKMRKGEKLMEEHFDMADGVAVGYYAYRMSQAFK